MQRSRETLIWVRKQWLWELAVSVWFSMMALKARGVNEVYVVDVMDKRLDKAIELGATGVINGMKEDVVAKVRELTDGKGTDLVIETAAF